MMEQQTTTNENEALAPYAVFAQLLITHYISPLVFCFGLVGNVLSLLLMQRPNYSKSSLWVYLRFMAVCDIGYITVQGVQRFVGRFFPLREILGSFFCKEVHYFALVTGMSTCFGLTFMTADRFVAVAWPLNAGVSCTRKRAILTCSIVSITISILCLPNLTRELSPDSNLSDRERCIFNPEWLAKPVYILLNIGIILTPFLVSILNCGIVLLIQRSKRQRSQMSSATKDKQQSQMDVLLLVASSFFCVIVFSYLIDWAAFAFFIPQQTLRQILVRRTSYEFGHLMVLCNSSFNLYLYCFSSATIRKDLREMLLSVCLH
jgi:hypothetical protein